MLLVVMRPSPEQNHLASILRREGTKFTCVTAWRSVANILEQNQVSAILLEHDHPEPGWPEFLTHLEAATPAPPPVIIAARHADERLWAEVLNRGGFDVLAIPFDADEVRYAVAMAGRHGRPARALAAAAF